MKSRLIIIVFVTLAIGGVLFSALVPPHTTAQKPPYRLNPESVKALGEIFQEARAENDRHAAVMKALGDRQTALYTGAGIPQSDWDKPIEKIEADGTLVFQPRPLPSPVPSPKTP